MKITVPLSVAGIETLITAVEDYQRWLKQKSSELLERLAQEGFEIVKANFDKAAYDGTKDVSVSVEERGSTVRAVVAVGASVLFIEFGTGVIKPFHPETPEGLGRGSWSDGPNGKGHWQDPGGWYYAHGKKTRGNPANMSMYEAVKELQSRLPKLAKEVFQ